MSAAPWDPPLYAAGAATKSTERAVHTYLSPPGRRSDEPTRQAIITDELKARAAKALAEAHNEPSFFSADYFFSLLGYDMKKRKLLKALELFSTAGKLLKSTDQEAASECYREVAAAYIALDQPILAEAAEVEAAHCLRSHILRDGNRRLLAQSAAQSKKVRDVVVCRPPIPAAAMDACVAAYKRGNCLCLAAQACWDFGQMLLEQHLLLLQDDESDNNDSDIDARREYNRAVAVAMANAYTEAAQLYTLEAARWSGCSKESQIHQCWMKVALLEPDLEQARPIFERVAEDRGRCGQPKELYVLYMFWVLRHLAAGNADEACQQILLRCKQDELVVNKNGRFQASTQCHALERLIAAHDARDARAFCDAISNFERVTPIDSWKSSMLTRARRRVNNRVAATAATAATDAVGAVGAGVVSGL